MSIEKPIRVMRLIARLNTGGPAIHVSLLTKGLQDDEFESVLVTGVISPDEGDMSYLAVEMGVTPVVIPTLGREISPLRDIQSLLYIMRLMRQWRPHVVHTHTAKAGFVGRLAAFLTGVPIIIHTFHGHVFHGYFGRAKTQLFLTLERWAARASTIILTISEKLRDELLALQIAPVDKFRVIPLGLDLTPFAENQDARDQFKNELDLSPDTKVVGIVGRLVPIKNHEMFLDVAGQVITSQPGVHFVIIGDGERREALEQMVVDKGLFDNVTFTGWRRDLPAVYAGLDAVVITSHNEGTPVSLIEAMAAGVPVISTAVGGVPDLLQQGELGRLVPPDEIEQMTNAVLETFRNPPTERIRDAQAQIMQHYHYTRLVKDIRALYISLLSDAAG